MRYVIEGNKLYIHWSLHLTVGYEMSKGVDGDYIVFDDPLDADLFLIELDAAGVTGAMFLHSYDGDFNAVSVNELIELIDNVQLTA